MKLKRSIVALSAVAALVSLAACSSGEAPAESSPVDYDCANPNADTMTDITIAGLPILTNAAIFVGMDEGIFQKHGLNAAMEMVASPPASISALMGGSADFAFTGTSNLIQAVDEGQPIRAVSPFAGVEPGFYEKMQAGEPDYDRGINALLVSGASGIDSAQDLEGKTVSVTDPAFGQLLASAWMKQNGGNPDKVKFVIMNAADGYAALLAGQVDAAQTLEPFNNGFEDEGLKNLAYLEVEIFKNGAPMSMMVATDKFIAENGETVARFGCAMAEASEYANDHHDELRKATAREQNVAPDSFDGLPVFYFFPSFDERGVMDIQDKMVEDGLIDEALAFDDLVATEALPAGLSQ